MRRSRKMLKMADRLKCTFSRKVQQVLLTDISQAQCMHSHSTSLHWVIVSGHTFQKQSKVLHLPMQHTGQLMECRRSSKTRYQPLCKVQATHPNFGLFAVFFTRSNTNLFSSSDLMIARSPVRFWQVVRASLHLRVGVSMTR